MRIFMILDHVDSGQVSLPAFQHGSAWNREDARGVIESLCRRYSVVGNAAERALLTRMTRLA